MPPHLAPLDPSDLLTLLGADASLYPSPLTLASLTSWTTTAPYLSLKYVSTPTSRDFCGVCIILPLLERFWDALVRGDMKEWDITPEHLWSDGKRGERVGLHVWHIERFEDWEVEWSGDKGFGEYCWRDVEYAVEGMRERECGGVKGCSALCVSPAGERLFRKLGYRESEWYRGQVVVKAGNSSETAIVERNDWELRPDKGEVVADCKMMVKLV